MPYYQLWSLSLIGNPYFYIFVLQDEKGAAAERLGVGWLQRRRDLRNEVNNNQ